jgi:hypothetical protein
MRRRELVAALLGIIAAPRAARSQEPGRVHRIAYLGPSSQSLPPHRAFRAALGELGFVGGKDLEIETRGNSDRFRSRQRRRFRCSALHWSRHVFIYLCIWQAGVACGVQRKFS